MTDAGKGSARRPGEGFAEGADRIWPPTPKHCPACGYLPAWCICTNDGLGQENEEEEAK